MKRITATSRVLSARPFIRYRPYLGHRASSVLAFIHSYHAEHGYSPSYREICDELGFNDKGDVGKVIKGLERRALVSRVGHGRVRRIRISHGQ